MKPEDPLTTLFRHHLWANLLLLERCAALTSGQLEASVPGAYGSIADTLRHIVRAEIAYLSRIRTGQPHVFPQDAPPMTLVEMVASARSTGQGLIEWAPRVQPGDTVQINWFDGSVRQVPKSILLTQVINHASEHRAQVMAILTSQGIEPPDLQAWAYFDGLE